MNWTREEIDDELLESLDVRFDDQDRLCFLGEDGVSGDSAMLEVDWNAREARYTTRSTVVCDDDDLDMFVEHHIGELRRRSVSGQMPACSFCEKKAQEVAKLIAGPRSYICDECVTLCMEIIEEEANRR